MKRFPWALVAVMAMSTAVVAADNEKQSTAILQIVQSLKKQPETFELTLMSYYSDDDFGYHMQTAALPRGDYLYPRQRISPEAAGAIVRQLAKTTFAKAVREVKRDARTRPAKPQPIRRVFGITLRSGDRAYFADVQELAQIKKLSAAIAAALKESKSEQRFQESFQAKLEK